MRVFSQRKGFAWTVAICFVLTLAILIWNNFIRHDRFLVTVWVVRPVVVNLPTYKQLISDKRRGSISDIQDCAMCSDAEIVSKLNAANPFLNFPKIEHKLTVSMSAGEWQEFSTASSSALQMKIRLANASEVRDYLDKLSKSPGKGKGDIILRKDTTRILSTEISGQIVLEDRSPNPTSSSSQSQVTTKTRRRFRTSRLLPLDQVVFVTPILHFEILHPKVARKGTTTVQPVVRQTIIDLLLVSVHTM